MCLYHPIATNFALQATENEMISRVVSVSGAVRGMLAVERTVPLLFVGG